MAQACPLNLIRCAQTQDSADGIGGAWAWHARFPEALAGEWTHLCGMDRPFFQPAFLRVLDEDPALERAYLVFQKEGRLLAAFAFQRGVLDGRQLGDFAPEQKEEARIPWPPALLRYGRKRLREIRWPLAYLGTPLAPDDPGYALDASLQQRRTELLADAFARIGQCWNGLRADLALNQSGLPAGFAALEAEPEFVLELPVAWSTFEDYLAALQSKYRVHARRMLKASRRLQRRELDLEDIRAGQAHWERLYGQVSARADFSLAEAGPGHFARMKAAYGPAFRFVAWYLPEADRMHDPLASDGSIMKQFPLDHCIGFQSALLERQQAHPDLGGTLHTRFIGLDYQRGGPFRLYNRMLYNYLEMALEAQCSKVDFGRTAAESKSVIGAEPRPTQFAFRYRNRLFNPVVGLLAAEARPPAWQERHPFKDAP